MCVARPKLISRPPPPLSDKYLFSLTKHRGNQQHARPHAVSLPVNYTRTCPNTKIHVMLSSWASSKVWRLVRAIWFICGNWWAAEILDFFEFQISCWLYWSKILTDKTKINVEILHFCQKFKLLLNFLKLGSYARISCNNRRCLSESKIIVEGSILCHKEHTI